MTQHPIAAFLTARWNELEQKARATAYSFASSIEDPWSVRQKDRRDEMSWAVYTQGKYLKVNDLYEADARHIVAHDPAYVLADIAAKRQILTQIFAYEAKIDGEWGCCHSAEEIAAGQCPDINPEEIPALRALALPFAQHPEYQEKWTP